MCPEGSEVLSEDVLATTRGPEAGRGRAVGLWLLAW